MFVASVPSTFTFFFLPLTTLPRIISSYLEKEKNPLNDDK